MENRFKYILTWSLNDGLLPGWVSNSIHLKFQNLKFITQLDWIIWMKKKSWLAAIACIFLTIASELSILFSKNLSNFLICGCLENKSTFVSFDVDSNRLEPFQNELNWTKSVHNENRKIEINASRTRKKN